MKKKFLVMLLACSMLAGTAACGKDTKADSNVQANEESPEGLTVESTITIELGEDDEGAFAP